MYDEAHTADEISLPESLDEFRAERDAWKEREDMDGGPDRTTFLDTMNKALELGVQYEDIRWLKEEERKLLYDALVYLLCELSEDAETQKLRGMLRRMFITILSEDWVESGFKSHPE